MRKLLVLISFIISGCATAPASNFITVNMMKCLPLSKLYPARNIQMIDSFYHSSTECGITYQNIRVKKDLIRAFYTTHSVRTAMANEIDLKITNVNVPHCVIQTDKTNTDISMTCEKLEELLK